MQINMVLNIGECIEGTVVIPTVDLTRGHTEGETYYFLSTMMSLHLLLDVTSSHDRSSFSFPLRGMRLPFTVKDNLSRQRGMEGGHEPFSVLKVNGIVANTERSSEVRNLEFNHT
jgi:hypothetical protein